MWARQHKIGLRTGSAVLLAAVAADACGRAPAPSGAPSAAAEATPAAAPASGAALHFGATSVDLGRVSAGAHVPVRFPFQVGPAPARVERLEVSCGCLRPRLELAGRAVALPAELPAGTAGVVCVDFVTTGFRGRKQATATLVGAEPAFSVPLEVAATLDPWCQVEPDPLDLGVIGGEAAETRDVVIRAAQPFRLLEAFPGLVEVEGVPSAEAALEQRVRVVVPADVHEDATITYVRLRADNGLELQFAVQFQVHRTLWIKPSLRLHLGAVPADSETHATVDVGVREGSLEAPQAALEGFPGARIEVVPLEPERRYRIRVVLPAGLPLGPRQGALSLRLQHRVNGATRSSERKLKVTALVQPAAGPAPAPPPQSQ